MAESQRSDWTATNICYLALMTFGYIFGEIAHFLVNQQKKARGKGSFTNYVYKQRWVGSQKMSTFMR